MAEPDFHVTGHATVLHVKDMATALAFYRDKLGFTVSFSWDEPAHYVCLCLGDAAIHLNSYVPPTGPSHVCIFCKGIDTLYAQCMTRGITIVDQIGDRAYGMRDFAIIDPDGHRLSFGQGISDH
jgi:catechol 2,3-dioxygenase-like lactoylglutathione lyase family enzyme